MPGKSSWLAGGWFWTAKANFQAREATAASGCTVPGPTSFPHGCCPCDVPVNLPPMSLCIWACSQVIQPGLMKHRGISHGEKPHQASQWTKGRRADVLNDIMLHRTKCPCFPQKWGTSPGEEHRGPWPSLLLAPAHWGAYKSAWVPIQPTIAWSGWPGRAASQS